MLRLFARFNSANSARLARYQTSVRLGICSSVLLFGFGATSSAQNPVSPTSVPTNATPANAPVQSLPSPSAAPVPAVPGDAPIQSQPIKPEFEVGLEFEGVRQLNRVALSETTYQGECPGTTTATVMTRFTSTKTPPASGRRVVLKAITRGLGSDPYPYTDREYQQGRSSEATRLAFGTRHDGAGLRVLPGENEFEYAIKENGRVIDSGTFTAVIDQNQQVVQRDAVAQTEQVCANTSVSLNVCADKRNRTQYKCPGGNVLRQFFEPNDTGIATFVSNQTFSPVYFTMNGEIQSLQPGENRTYRLNASSSLNLGFNPECTTCKPKRYLNLQLGKRYKFSAAAFGGKTVDLVDYPDRF